MRYLVIREYHFRMLYYAQYYRLRNLISNLKPKRPTNPLPLSLNPPNNLSALPRQPLRLMLQRRHLSHPLKPLAPKRKPLPRIPLRALPLPHQLLILPLMLALHLPIQMINPLPLVLEPVVRRGYLDVQDPDAEHLELLVAVLAPLVLVVAFVEVVVDVREAGLLPWRELAG